MTVCVLLLVAITRRSCSTCLVFLVDQTVHVQRSLNRVRLPSSELILVLSPSCPRTASPSSLSLEDVLTTPSTGGGLLSVLLHWLSSPSSSSPSACDVKPGWHIDHTSQGWWSSAHPCLSFSTQGTPELLKGFANSCQDVSQPSKYHRIHIFREQVCYHASRPAVYDSDEPQELHLFQLFDPHVVELGMVGCLRR